VVRNSVSSHLPHFLLFTWVQEREGNTSSNTSRGCKASSGGAEEQEGKDEGVKGLKEMKKTL